MNRLISKLIIYKDLRDDCLLHSLGKAIQDSYELSVVDVEYENKKDDIITSIYSVIYNILELGTNYGFDHNLWHNYLTFLLVTNENPFTISSERVGAKEGSVNHFAKGDFKIFKGLFNFDFTLVEEKLGIQCFSILCNYMALEKKKGRYNQFFSDRLKELSRALGVANDEDEIFDLVTEFYRHYGVGKFGLHKAFRIHKNGEKVDIIPVTNTYEVKLSQLVGYELQKHKLIENTRAFVEERTCNNVLLYGDSGTGKSTSVKAILNEFFDDGLRIIEVYKHQLEELQTVISEIKHRNYRFIIYMDDLSFEEFEIEYKYLKAVIEGGLEIKPDNVLIYATSNRRHLVRETWNDRSDIDQTGDIHRSDTMEEKKSLVSRFGVTIYYGAPDKKDYDEIVRQLAKEYPNIHLSEEEIVAKANQWEISHGGRSGRIAQQFIHYLSGTLEG